MAGPDIPYAQINHTHVTLYITLPITMECLQGTQ